MITVFHNKDFIAFNLKEQNSIPLSSLTKVAKVDTNDPEKAFELTNHINHNWTQNEGVTPLVSNPRSTSVGDVLKNDKYIVVSDIGFREIKIDEEN